MDTIVHFISSQNGKKNLKNIFNESIVEYQNFNLKFLYNFFIKYLNKYFFCFKEFCFVIFIVSIFKYCLIYNYLLVLISFDKT